MSVADGIRIGIGIAIVHLGLFAVAVVFAPEDYLATWVEKPSQVGDVRAAAAMVVLAAVVAVVLSLTRRVEGRLLPPRDAEGGSG